MRNYIIKRLLISVLILFCVTFIIYALLRCLPASYVEQQANLLKISIPDDLSLTGFDNSSLCSHLEIPLTSVAQNYEAIGKKVIELMNALRSGQPVQSEYLMSSSIVERASVRKLSQ